MMMEIAKKSRIWTPSTWIGWNTIEFDFKWLRQGFYQCLQQPYFHQFYGNRRADALPIARANFLLGEKKIMVNCGKRGKPSFRLEELTKANKIAHRHAHTALSDVHATINITKLVADKSPDIWKSSLLTSTKEDCEALIWKQPVFITTESIFGTTTARIMTAVSHHPIYNWTMALDLRVDPQVYQNLDEAELEKVLRKAPKLLRTIRTSNHPLILGLNYRDKIKEYRDIDEEELKRRARLIQRDTELKRKIEKLLIDEHKKKEDKNKGVPGRDGEIEERIHEKFQVPLGEEERILNIFESKENWKGRYELCKGFRERRLFELGMRLIFEESPEYMTREERLQHIDQINQRILREDSVPWTTVHSAAETIKTYEDKKLPPRGLEILESYKEYISEIKNGV
jgi:exodeoxyribonuclease-1